MHGGGHNTFYALAVKRPGARECANERFGQAARASQAAVSAFRGRPALRLTLE
ncbi:hypothetical protein AKJ09_08652 [Labilithrix luteola]|uniref:Uncharacterized protein n=1 Tax=Labilithrix luteola TaxID=1391654 RepID=A0A0K1Q8D3_9BACT|nr:hypothetical protein AKJ09_08652 [Labilithrix luteola]